MTQDASSPAYRKLTAVHVDIGGRRSCRLADGILDRGRALLSELRTDA